MKLKSLYTLLLLSLSVYTLRADDGNIDFIQNKNQFPEQVRFKADIPGGAVFLTQTGFTYSYYKASDLTRIHDLKHDNKRVENEPVHMHAYQVQFANANKAATLTEEGLQPYYNNYFIGNDSRKWAGHVPLFKKVIWHDIYADIDAVVYSKETSLKYDFIVRPNADVNQILLEYNGVHPEIKKDGSLLIKTSVNSLIEQAPYAYQMVDGKEVEVVCHFKKAVDGKIGFEFPQGYNKNLPLIIDPVLVFSTFSGSTVNTYGYSATYDNLGNLYAGGECFGVGWPYSLGAFQINFGGMVDAGINKYNANGTVRIYSTYFGGNATDLPNNMMVNLNDELVVCGSTLSSNLATTSGCFDNTYNGNFDIFIARFSVDGSQLKAATYLGGAADDAYNTFALSPNYGDANRGEVFTANNGNIYIANSSSSPNYPVTTNAYQSANAGQQDAVISELDSSLSTLIYSTYLGGNSNDAAFSLLLNSSNQIVVCGGTQSANFPTTAGAFKTAAPGGTDGFVSILSISLGLTHSTFLGTSFYDHAFKVQKDAADNILVLGQTDKTSDYPISTGAYAVTGGNIFIHKLNATLTASLASTRMGNTTASNSQDFVPTAFMYDLCGNTYFSGFFSMVTSPLTSNAYQTTPGSFWLGVLGPNFTSLLYSTYYGTQGTHVDGGSSRFDPTGIVYHSACTSDANFPTTPGVVAPVKLNNQWDVASFKLDMGMGAVDANFILANNAKDTGCADYHVVFENLSTGATGYNWSFGDGTTSTAVNPDHTFAEGTYLVTLVASKATGCNLADTASKLIVVKNTMKPLLHLRDTFLCDTPIVLQLNSNVSNPNNAFNYHWEPTSAITSNPNQPQVTVNPALSGAFSVYVGNVSVGECVDSAEGVIHVRLNDYSTMTVTPIDTSICPGDTLMIRAFGGRTVYWSPNERIENTEAMTTHVWPNKNIVYAALITNDSGCSITRNVTVKMLPPINLYAGIDKEIKRGESTQIMAHADGPFYWTPAGIIIPGNSLNPTVTPDTTTTYYLHSTSLEGCHNMDSVTVYVTNAMLPNAFSPNGDGTNDLFRLTIKDERVHLKDFNVYNRYGQRVFYTRNVTEGWDGNFNFAKCELGTYFYLVHYIIGEKTYTLKGDVTLIR
jgi:gliding motility-associated-like protein